MAKARDPCFILVHLIGKSDLSWMSIRHVEVFRKGDMNLSCIFAYELRYRRIVQYFLLGRYFVTEQKVTGFVFAMKNWLTGKKSFVIVAALFTTCDNNAAASAFFAL